MVCGMVEEFGFRIEVFVDFCVVDVVMLVFG